MVHVTIIGAGIAGLTCAHELCERGITVEILERASQLGAGACSWHAGGMLAPWCEGESAEEPVTRLGRKAIAWWQKHGTDESNMNTKKTAITKNGSLVVALSRDLSELNRFARRTSHFTEIDHARLTELEPDLAERFRKGLFFSEEAHLDPRAALIMLAERLVQKGVSLHFNRDIEDIEEIAPNSDWILDCRGFSARDQLTDLRGVKGEMLYVQSRDIQFQRPIRLLHPRIPLYIIPRGDGLFMIGATMIESNDGERITARSMIELLNGAYALHPAFGEAEIVEIGVDIRPAFADNLPRIRRNGRILHVNGLYRHGYLLAPSLAEQVADIIVDGMLKVEFMDENYPKWGTA